MAASIHAPSASLFAALQDPQASQPVTQPPAKGEVELDVDVNDGSAWYTDPVWIVIGVAALVIIVALIAMAGRGGGTTVVREAHQPCGAPGTARAPARAVPRFTQWNDGGRNRTMTHAGRERAMLGP